MKAEVWEHRDYGYPLQVEATCQSCNVRRGPAKHSDVPRKIPGLAIPKMDVSILSARERQVLDLVWSGWRPTNIATLLGIDRRTVSTYKRRALDKHGSPT
jgi:DNA-binding CsgD family transcriptional regulator